MNVEPAHPAHATIHAVPTMGILGAGQLGRMLALGAARLGVRCVCFDPEPGACAGDVARLVTAPWDDRDALATFARSCDAITFEFENVPVATLRAIQDLGTRASIRPGILALETGQDRLLEKQLFQRVGLGVHAYQSVSTQAQFRAACEQVGLLGANAPGQPSKGVVAKTRRGGYDGKGQVVVRHAHEIDQAWRALAPQGEREVLVEEFVLFEREVSLIGVRGVDGSFDSYPLTQNVHRQGILRESLSPAPGHDASLAQDAQAHMAALMHELKYVGVLAIEFCVVRDASGNERLLANEMAPRVHNSGHWTIDGAATCQFENHVRAVLGLPIGPCDARAGTSSLMVNFIGRMPERGSLLRLSGVHVHDYAKAPREGRKVGHATWVGSLPSESVEHLRRLGAG